MKKILFISLFLWGCTKPELPSPQILANDNIFSVTESSVTNGQSIHFDLPSVGTYTLSLIDRESGQVISRERFVGQSGENVKKIYTKTIQIRYLYLVLENTNKQEIGKTTLILN